MAAEDIRKHQFTSDNQPKTRRSRKGIPNRSTTLRKWLKGRVQLYNLPPGMKAQTGTVEDQIALALIGRAVRGNVPAIREILDTVYGKQTETTLNVTMEQLQKLSDEELDGLLRSMGYQPLETVAELKTRFAARQQQVSELDDDGP